MLHKTPWHLIACLICCLTPNSITASRSNAIRLSSPDRYSFNFSWEDTSSYSKNNLPAIYDHTLHTASHITNKVREPKNITNRVARNLKKLPGDHTLLAVVTTQPIQKTSQGLHKYLISNKNWLNNKEFQEDAHDMNYHLIKADKPTHVMVQLLGLLWAHHKTQQKTIAHLIINKPLCLQCGYLAKKLFQQDLLCKEDGCQKEPFAWPMHHLAHAWLDNYVKTRKDVLKCAQHLLGNLVPQQKKPAQQAGQSVQAQNQMPPLEQAQNNKRGGDLPQVQQHKKIRLIKEKNNDVVQWTAAKQRELSKKKDTKGQNLLHIACIEGNLKMVQSLIKKQDMNPRITDDYNKNTLHLACEHGHFEIVKWLIEACDMKPKVKDYDKKNALHLACEHGHLEIVKWLIQNCQMKPKTKEHLNCNALYFACKHGHLEIVQWIIQNCDMNINAPVGGWLSSYSNLLQCACEYGQFEIAKWLITACKMDPKVKNGNGRDALYLARNSYGEKNRQLINFLIQKMK